MNFFRLRLINTLLFFLVGAIIGFIVKEKFYPSSQPAYHQRYQSVYAGRQEEPADAAAPDDAALEQEAEQEPEPAPLPVKAAKRPAEPRAEEESYSSPIVIEPAEPGAKSGDEEPRVARGVQDDFFSRPASYAGREVEMPLQLITAKRSARGWRLNFVYTGPNKNIDYLYVDDAELLGDKPDLRIGYVYRVRFRCGKGDPAAGNTLSLLTATGDKASWATGISAVE